MNYYPNDSSKLANAKQEISLKSRKRNIFLEPCSRKMSVLLQKKRKKDRGSLHHLVRACFMTELAFSFMI